MTAMTETREGLIPLAEQHLIVDQWALAQAGTLTLGKCGEALVKITQIGSAVRYWRGDLMNLAETLFHEESSQIIDSDYLTEAEAKAERFVAEKVKPTTRAHSPSWEHSRAVAKLPDEQQVEWLDRATAEDWSAGKLKTEMSLAGAAKTFLQWMCVVDCGTENKRDKLADRLEGEGFTVLKRDKVKKQPKPKKAKKGEVTAKRRGPKKMNQARRPPK